LPKTRLIDVPPAFEGFNIVAAQLEPFVALGFFGGKSPVPVGFDAGRVVGLDFVDSLPLVGGLRGQLTLAAFKVEGFADFIPLVGLPEIDIAIGIARFRRGAACCARK